MNLQDFKYFDNKLDSLFSDFEQLLADSESAAKERQARISHKAAEVAACLHGMRRAMQQPMPFDSYVSPLRYRDNGMQLVGEMQPIRPENDLADAMAYAMHLHSLPAPKRQTWVEQAAALFPEHRVVEAAKPQQVFNSSQRYNQRILDNKVRHLALTEIGRVTEVFAQYAEPAESFADFAKRVGETPTLREFVAEFLNEPAPIERKQQARKETIFEYESAKPELLEARGMKLPHFYGMGGNRFCVYLLHGSTWYIESQRLGKVIAFAFNGNAKRGLWNYPNDTKPVLLGGGRNAKATLGEVLTEATCYVQKVELN
jgi:hypothetical protein